MSIQDFRDELDAARAQRFAESHGDSNSIMAFRDRLDAEKAKRQVEINNQHAAERTERYSRRYDSLTE